MGFEQVMIQVEGYQRRKNDSWQQTRILAYTIACTVTEPEKRGEIYDMFPLPGDPTEAQRKKLEQEEFERRRKEAKELTELVRASLQYKS